ncbi:hypothetical protein [Candidatus Symbiopectobacterium sp. NZEC135]|uniref:hypothetical protein n=1 Tax=Candidatus Symbiopectobacterium sp. NZEC135 TaxID=2820471 RepID=UPI002226734B|nr:hypothetical protein [Candidatus Symbiopectobacterium sp. NZEC135]MCW2478510.1 hypothetical protein [Candidatus Symbiopectobacterium sp. NZEC135]
MSTTHPVIPASSPFNSDAPGPRVTSSFSNEYANLLYVEQLIPQQGKIDVPTWAGCSFEMRGLYGTASLRYGPNPIDKLPDPINNTPYSYLSFSGQIYITHSLPLSKYSSSTDADGTQHVIVETPYAWTPNSWYTTVIRSWVSDLLPERYIAVFIYSYSANKWTHCLSGQSPSIEDENPLLIGKNCTSAIFNAPEGNSTTGVFGQHYFMDMNGSWVRPNYYTAWANTEPQNWNAELYQNVNILLKSEENSGNSEHQKTFFPNQYNSKPKPVVSPHLQSLESWYDFTTGKIELKWKISENTPPQFKVFIKIHKDSVYGPLQFETSSYSIDARETSIHVGSIEAGQYFATLEFIDIFNNKSNFGYNGFTVP